jgi:hypothetical protein
MSPVVVPFGKHTCFIQKQAVELLRYARSA